MRQKLSERESLAMVGNERGIFKRETMSSRWPGRQLVPLQLVQEMDKKRECAIVLAAWKLPGRRMQRDFIHSPAYGFEGELLAVLPCTKTLIATHLDSHPVRVGTKPKRVRLLGM